MRLLTKNEAPPIGFRHVVALAIVLTVCALFPPAFLGVLIYVALRGWHYLQRRSARLEAERVADQKALYLVAQQNFQASPEGRRCSYLNAAADAPLRVDGKHRR